MDSEILKYRSSLAYNREVFLIEHGAMMKAFDQIDQNFIELVEFPQKMRDVKGKSYPSLIPFLLLFQRQSRAAFESCAVFQAYQAWVLLRPGVEALLIVGKFIDDRKFVTIWQNRKQDPEAYRRAFSGRNLRSTHLASSDKFQKVLSRINDDFVHANVEYLSRHLGVNTADREYTTIGFDYFDRDESQEANVLALLHLVLIMQASLAALFAKLFGTDVMLKAGPERFLGDFGHKIASLASRSHEAKAIFGDLGLVTLENLSVT
jgi:hypothetical protein